MEKNGLSENVEIPNGINVNVEGSTIKVRGSKEEIIKKINSSRIKIKNENNKLNFSVEGSSRKDKDILNTIVAHFRNMLEGANSTYTYKLKVCSGHFPMNVTVDKEKVIIKNFIGEKLPRVAKIIQGVQVKVNGDIIIVESNDKDKAGQVSANIEIATKIPHKDRRVFQDGIFLVEKAGEIIK